MSLRPWHILLVLAALIVPLQAGALDGGGGPLTVTAALDYCGVGPGGISCKVDASWSGVEDAETYTATATLADGSVVDLGTIGSGPGGGSSSFWLPYAGNGIYTVTVSAWGTDPEGREKKLEDADAKATLKDKEGQDKPKPDKQDGSGKADDGPGGSDGDSGGADGGGALGGAEPAEPPAEPEEQPPAEQPPAPGPDPEPDPEPAPQPKPAPEQVPAGSQPTQPEGAGAKAGDGALVAPTG